MEDEGGLIYLRPETAQGIYVNYKNVLQTGRVKVPFGIAQVGKAFRNEITTKNFIFRTCEFEQMEMQYFVHPSEDMKWFEHWKERRFQYYLDLGVRKSKLRFHQHGPDELAHYAKLAFDIQYEFPFGWKELEGIHNRTDYDLKRHTEFSGQGPHVPGRGDPRALHPVHHRDLRGAHAHGAGRPLGCLRRGDRGRGEAGGACASIRASRPSPWASSRW